MTGLINEESADFYRLITDKLNQMIPCEWERVVLHASISEAYCRIKFFFYENFFKIHYSDDISMEYDINPKDIDDLLNELTILCREFSKSLDYTEWNSFTLYLDNGQTYMIKFAKEHSENLSELEIEDYKLYEDIIAYFTVERLKKDARSKINDLR